MIIALLFAAAEPAQAPGIEEQRFADCVKLTETDPLGAVRVAEAWRLSGGTLNSRLCLGLAYAAQGRWPAARLAFELAAQEAEKAKDRRSSSFWVQAGNAALAAAEPLQARNAFDAALTTGFLSGAELGEAHLDRARAHAALKAPEAARSDIDKALTLVPADPLAWLLSATLARRSGDLKRAETDIGEAAKRAPDDPSVALEAGNIAAMLGATDAARVAWAAAVRNGPDTPAGKSAVEALKQFEGEATQPRANPPKTAGQAPVAAPR